MTQYLRKDFSYEVSHRGYMLLYKGQRISGAGVLHSAFGHSRKHTPKQIEEHKKYAEIDIQRILIGNLGYYKKALDEIDGVVAE